MTSLPEVYYAHDRKCILAFFLTIVVIQNVSLLMAESSMATGCDVTESDVIRPKVRDSPCGVIFFVRGVV